ncbi:MAG: polyprenyl synthetase family protein [Mucilaginibacter polytrichastri]|nr:polyprenyl synthetase family protein [Mucilaginibacter polytrichastri]
MYPLKDLQQLLEARIAAHTYPVQPAELYEPISYILSLGGKRMRPALLLMACDLFGGDVKKALDPAMAIEVFHNFTLVHDDLMDNAPLRRGKATVHEKWNPNVAILSGDVMLVEAYKLIMQVDTAILKPVLNTFNATAQGVCEGQQLDMLFETRSNVDAAEYVNMIRLKTAVLLGGALRIGALIAGATETDAGKLYAFGEQVGIAFQLQDDILDVYGDPEKFGKQVGGDIIANKKTWLLIRALEEDASGELKSWLQNSDADPAEKVKAVTGIYTRLNIRQQAEEQMEHYAGSAMHLLDQLAVPEECKTQLRNFAGMLLIRES